MRISFFDPPPSHFYNPCPRCQGVLVSQIRNKYQDPINLRATPEMNLEEQEESFVTNLVRGQMNRKEQGKQFSFPDVEQEIVVRAPKPLPDICICCGYFRMPAGETCHFCENSGCEDYCFVAPIMKETNERMES